MAFLAGLVIANPIIVFLLIRDLRWTAAVSLGCVLVAQFAVSERVPTIARVYMFNALSILTIFAHAEVLILYGFPDYVVPNLYEIRDRYYFNAPLLQQQFNSSEFSVTYRTNAQGFRIGIGQEPAHRIESADWLVIGDSFTQGAQVEFEDLFSTRLNVRFPDKIVVNAGISGMGVAQEYQYFVDSGKQLRPSWVILQIGSFNDFMNVGLRDAGFSEWLMTKSAFVRLLLSDLKYQDPRDLPLGRWTEPFYPDADRNRAYNVFYKDATAGKQTDLREFSDYVRWLNGAVKAAGGRLLVVLLPTREQVYEQHLAQVLSSFKIDVSHVDMYRPNAIVKALATAEHIEFVDLLPAFKAAGDRLFFAEDEHLRSEGHAVVAKAIGDFFEQREGAATVELLSQQLAGDRYPLSSNDGQFISYQSIRDGGSEIFVTDPEFRQQRRITTTRIDESHPMLSKDNQRVLFTEGPAESMRTEVVLRKLDGSGTTVITAEPDVHGAIATFSPSNIRVAYAEWKIGRDGTASSPRIAVLDLLTGEKAYITRPDQEAWRPVFSPDERRIAYILKSKEQFDLHIYDVPTGRTHQITDSQYDEWDPQFTPDGKRLIYAAKRDGNWDLFSYDFESAKVDRITETRGDEWDPSVTPGGNKLLFAGRFGSLEAVFAMPLPR